MELEEKFWNACKAINGNKTYDEGAKRDICFLDIVTPKSIFLDREEIIVTESNATKRVQDIKIEDNEMIIETAGGIARLNKSGILSGERGSIWRE